jgi:putative chitinase
MLTATQLQSIMPGLSAKRNGEFLPFLQAAMTEFGIEAPARAAAFLAQLAHESGQFRFMEEIWGPTPAQRRYEPASTLATTLGNTEAGDGRRFKGRGPIQITGRANYRRFGDLLGIELVADPARAASPDLAFRIAGLFWSKKGLNELADLATAEAFREITRRINGGFNGLEDRRKFYAAARTVLGVVEPPATRDRAPVPGAAEEPVFERGYEAIRAHVRRKRMRKTAPPARKRKTRRATGKTRRATIAGSRKTKARSAAKRRKPARRSR